MSTPYRIRQKNTSVRKVSRGAAGEAYKEYLDRLMRLVPAEVIGLYLIGSGFVPVDQTGGHVAWLTFCFVALLIIRIYGTTDRRTPTPQWGAIAISSLAFFVWVYSIGAQPFDNTNLYVPWVASLLVLAASFLMPYVYGGEQE